MQGRQPEVPIPSPPKKINPVKPVIRASDKRVFELRRDARSLGSNTGLRNANNQKCLSFKK